MSGLSSNPCYLLSYNAKPSVSHAVANPKQQLVIRPVFFKHFPDSQNTASFFTAGQVCIQLKWVLVSIDITLAIRDYNVLRTGIDKETEYFST